jgi:hypothetical protein
MLRRVIGWTLAAAAAIVIIQNLPDIARYMKIRSM